MLSRPPSCGHGKELEKKSRNAASFRVRQQFTLDLASGDVVQLVRTLPCHGRGRGFESRRPRHSFQVVAGNWQFRSWSNLVQLGQCLPFPKYKLDKFALSLPLLWHSCLRVQVESDPAVCVSQ
jgi:hypothetical protein